MIAVWRRRPKTPVMIHSDKGSEFGSDEFNRWCKDNLLLPSMFRRENCWDTQSKISSSAAFGLTRAGTGVMPLR